jgi:hypothetical protein
LLITLFLLIGCDATVDDGRDRKTEWNTWVDIVNCFHANGFEVAGVLPNVNLVPKPCDAPVLAPVDAPVFEVQARTCNPTTIEIRPKFYRKQNGDINTTLLRHEYKHAYLWQATGEIGSHNSIWYGKESPCPDKEQGESE